uniref:Uncharacterized protein n=1 Tax=Candidatus Kentrum sp. DK TaxID=2126562 RepID=A0A450TR75_9GAMM|nr:MAG: hypothetical protein BECKDK2373C_GA0170839_104323 [Candidatus Kentron sp. DK]VFJ70657.1 MAG: hypothetical protein BECKDK2373B_GA0170837_12932 [Candidatus Kentron sp. DK]
MKAASLSDNKQRSITLRGILPDVRRLPSYDKLKLIRILAEELESSKNIFPFEQGKTYSLPTPYNTFGAGEILMRTLKGSEADK